MLDLEVLFRPVAGDAPCGPDLRGETDFRDVEEMPLRFKDMAPAELKAAVGQCAALLERSKDQLPAIIALQAGARMGSVETMTAALTLLRHFVVEHWSDYHPGPAEEMMVARLNELAALTKPAALALPLDRLALAKLPAPSSVELTWGVIQAACAVCPKWTSDDDQRIAAQVASGQLTKLAAKGQQATREAARQLRMVARALSPAARAADLDAGSDDGDGPGIDAGQLLSTALTVRGQVGDSRERLQQVADLLYDISDGFERGGGESPGLGPVLSQLRTMIAACDQFLAAFPEPGDDAPPAEAEAGPSTANPGAAPARATAGASGYATGQIRSRQDVLTALDAVCAYYVDAEPGSPVPLMLRRVRKWVTLDFIGLIQEINPDNVDDIRKLLAVERGDDD